MTDEWLDDEELSPPDRPDFRRVGRWKSPHVLKDGKRVIYGRPSNSGKILDDESNLVDWKLRTSIYGAAFRPDLMAQASTLDPQKDKGELRDIQEECLTAGKGRERSVKGTAVHSMFDHLDRQDDWEPAPQWLDLCISYTDTLELWGLVPVDIEVPCINHKRRLAGKADRRYRTTKVLVAPDATTVPIGSMLVGDTKTGAVLEYAAGSYATQLAAYAESDYYDLETEETIPFSPPTNQDWALVIHADSGGTEVQVYWVDLAAGRQGLDLAQEVKGWRQRADLLLMGPGPVLATSAPAPAADVPPQAPGSPVDGSRLASLHQHTRDRVRAVLDHSEVAGKALARSWPQGVPGLKQETHTWEELEAIIEVVEKVEADHSVPFFPAWQDPENPRQRHPSFSDRWAKPSTTDRAPDEARADIQQAINAHPRKELLRQWVGMAVEGGIDHNLDTYALSHALLEFASINTDGWSTEPIGIDEALSTFLEGTLRALGYKRGLLDLGKINPDHAPQIMAAAFSITSGTAMLLYQEDGTCILRTNIVRNK